MEPTSPQPPPGTQLCSVCPVRSTLADRAGRPAAPGRVCQLLRFADSVTFLKVLLEAGELFDHAD